MLACAAVIAGAVWAIAAIVDDDDEDAPLFGVAPSFDGRHDDDDRRKGRDDRGPSKGGDKFEREERERRGDERRGRDFKDRDSEKWAKPDGWTDSDRPFPTEGCRKILSLGVGDEAVTLFVCNLPGGESHEELELDEMFEDGTIPDLPLELLPFFGLMGEDWFEGDGGPFGPFGPFGERWPEGDEWPFGGEGRPFRGERPQFEDAPWPFDGDGGSFGWVPVPLDRDGGSFGWIPVPEGDGGLFDEDMYDERWPFGGGMEIPFGNGARGFWYGNDGAEDGFCFSQGDQMNCYSDSDLLPGDAASQFEQLMEMLREVGLGDLFGFEFPESPEGPSGDGDEGPQGELNEEQLGQMMGLLDLFGLGGLGGLLEGFGEFSESPSGPSGGEGALDALSGEQQLGLILGLLNLFGLGGFDGLGSLLEGFDFGLPQVPAEPSGAADA